MFRRGLCSGSLLLGLRFGGLVYEVRMEGMDGGAYVSRQEGGRPSIACTCFTTSK